MHDEQRVHLDDRIWYNIFSYFGHEYGKSRHVNLKRFRPAHLFRAFSLVSKEDRDRLIDYTRRVPQKLFFRRTNSKLLYWLCNSGVKLEFIDFYGQIKNHNDFALLLMILETCNTTSLKTLKLNLNWSSLSSKEISNQTLEKIKDSTRELLVNGEMFSSSWNNLVRNFLLEHASAITTFDISISSDQLKIPFFTERDGHKSLIHNLTINVQKGSALDITPMLNDITKLSNLKKLRLIAGFTDNIERIRIESQTVEEIDIRECRSDFVIESCNCPSLKLLHGKMIPRRRWKVGYNGPLASPPLTRNEVRDLIKNGEYVDFDDSFYGHHTIQYNVHDRGFLGMNVPKSCSVKIDMLNYD